jgi:hypothetical protein
MTIPHTLSPGNTVNFSTGTKQVKSSPIGSKNKIKESLNQLLEIESIAYVAEKRGWHWAMTSFAIEVGEKQKKREDNPL